MAKVHFQVYKEKDNILHMICCLKIGDFIV